MKLLIVTYAIFHALVIEGAIFRVPLRSVASKAKYISTSAGVSSERLPTDWDWNPLTYVTAILIGSPPVKLITLLSLSSPHLVLPYFPCGHDPERGQPEANCPNPVLPLSSTVNYDRYISSPLSFHRSIGGAPGYDTVQIGNLVTSEQNFIQTVVTESHPHHFLDWDGILGLAPTSSKNDTNALVSEIMNPFSTVVQRKWLDRNLFSLQLPRNEKDTGELLFGGVDRSAFTGNLLSMPLVASDESETRHWAVKADSMSLGSGFIDLNGFIAFFETDYPFIGLPARHLARLNQYMGMERKHSSGLLSVDCSKRRHLENLTITLSGEDFTISPWEYTVETQLSGFEKGGTRCVSAFAPVPEGEKRILLGSVFLKAFYGVFDLDDQTVSLARLRSQRIKETNEFDIQELRRGSHSRSRNYP